MMYPVLGRGHILTRLLAYAMLFAVVIMAVGPLIWMVFGSLKGEGEFTREIWGLPSEPVWANYPNAWIRGEIGSKLVNSVVVTVGTLAIAIPLTTLAAYAFAMLKFPGNRLLFFYFLLGLMIPDGIAAIPVFSVVLRLGILNTRISLILAYVAQATSFGIFLMRAFFLSMPKELVDAAKIDGCSPVGAFVRVILPLTRPGLATLAVFVGMRAWNEFFMASVLIRSAELETLPLGLVRFVGHYVTDYPEMFAFLCITTVPVVFMYMLGQEQFVSGLTAGALKG